MRQLVQPGPVAPERVDSVAGGGRTFPILLEPGASLNDAVALALLPLGVEGAALALEGGGFSPFAYVLPGPSNDPNYAAYYSRTFRPAGETRLERANVTFGRRDGEPFLHCHAVWTGADGRRGGGHILPHDAVVSAPIRGQVWTIDGVGQRSAFDPETNFTLFGPVGSPGAAGGLPRMATARLRPNVDLFDALATVCRRHGFATAAVRGSVGSLIDPVFLDGTKLDSVSTELLVRRGIVRTDGPGERETELDVILVDVEGRVHEGPLVPGMNPVCITFEVMLEEIQDEPSRLS